MATVIGNPTLSRAQMTVLVTTYSRLGVRHMLDGVDVIKIVESHAMHQSTMLMSSLLMLSNPVSFVNPQF